MSLASQKGLFIQALDCTFAFRSMSSDYIKRLKEGGVTSIHETVVNPKEDFNETFKSIYRFRKKCDPKEVRIVSAASDIEESERDGKLAMIMGLQNLPFASSYYPDNLGFLEMLYRLDVKIAQLTYQKRNLIGDGCGERTDSGLSTFGIRVVEEMNRLGMLIDLSHCGSKTTDETIEVSKDPVVFTHSNCRSLNDHVRNKNDEQTKALAEKGGVQGIGIFLPLLYNRGKPPKSHFPPTMPTFLDHIEYVIELVGVNHVGIGLDSYEKSVLHPDVGIQKKAWDAAHKLSVVNYSKLYESDVFVPGKRSNYLIEELEEPSQWKTQITKGLEDRGYSDSEIDKILGGNFMTVFRKVWKS